VALRIQRVPAATTFPLRQQILRPHQRLDEVVLPGDDDPLTSHFAALDDNARVVGTASVRPEQPPWSPVGGQSWRLRGMATTENLRRQGVGTALLAAVVEQVTASGGSLLWCNARIPAVGFYRRAGFRTWGEPWEEPQIGPHIVMYRSMDYEAGADPP
jgi:GNAT superfamily N-acetyltransferase